MNAITTEMDSNTGAGMYGPVAYAALLNKGWERVFELSKTSLELAVAQNAEVLASYKNNLRVSGFLLCNLASRTLEHYVTLHNKLLALAVGYLFVEATRESRDESRKSNAEMTKLLLESIDRMIAVQRSILSLSAKQTKGVSERPSVNTMPDEISEESAQLESDTLLAKEIVDLVVKQQPCIDGACGDADIVQLRVNPRGVDVVAKGRKKTDPSVH